MYFKLLHLPPPSMNNSLFKSWITEWLRVCLLCFWKYVTQRPWRISSYFLCALGTHHYCSDKIQGRKLLCDLRKGAFERFDTFSEWGGKNDTANSTFPLKGEGPWQMDLYLEMRIWIKERSQKGNPPPFGQHCCWMWLLLSTCLPAAALSTNPGCQFNGWLQINKFSSAQKWQHWDWPMGRESWDLANGACYSETVVCVGRTAL